jgi:hypothetical protein
MRNSRASCRSRVRRLRHGRRRAPSPVQRPSV